MTGDHTVVPLPAAPNRDDRANLDPSVVALTDRAGIGLFDLRTRTRTAIADPEPVRSGIGYNDAKVRRSGSVMGGNL